MKRPVLSTVIIAGFLLGAGSLVPAVADVTALPLKGQTPEQANMDRAECSQVATQQSGYNPAAPADSSQPGAVRGGARGAAAGAAIGAIAGDAGKGAAIGATAGAMKRGMQKHDQKKSTQAGASAYDQALKVCLAGRGYQVQ